jgi:hypothetical protein
VKAFSCHRETFSVVGVSEIICKTEEFLYEYTFKFLQKILTLGMKYCNNTSIISTDRVQGFIMYNI